MIEFKNLNLKFNDKIIFENFNYKIEKNDKILLNGKSGTGKTTLFRIICGFESVNSGEILYNNEILSHKNIHKIRNKIAYISQDVDLSNDTVSNILHEIYSYRGNKNLEYDEIKIKKLLKEFLLEEDTLNKNVRDLSGGERQRLGIIISILLDREIYLLDEITSGLDETLKFKIIDYFLNSDKTILAISHDTHWKKENIKELRW
ncbi:MAG: ABC transporter ATP-binding protein [Fusobacteria bacterium]|nr:ABC transporter ATP-binding protein [Fusobacteriota bacterium]